MPVKRFSLFATTAASAVAFVTVPTARAGPYATAEANQTIGAPDPGIPGFVGPKGEGVVAAGNTVNPAFVEWANGDVYQPAPGVAAQWSNASLALGPVTGNNADICSLGDLSESQIQAGVAPGQITLTFANPIVNGPGADFAVFENSFGTQTLEFLELGYVQVSSDGVHYAEFPSISLNPKPSGNYAYGEFDPTNVYNLAGKNINAYGNSWGTPFDLSSLATTTQAQALIAAGELDLNDITSVRIVDIPGSGDFKDSAGNSIYDPWLTTGSGGFDLEALGVLNAVPVPEPVDFIVMAASLAGMLRRRGAIRSKERNHV